MILVEDLVPAAWAERRGVEGSQSRPGNVIRVTPGGVTSFSGVATAYCNPHGSNTSSVVANKIGSNLAAEGAPKVGRTEL